MFALAVGSIAATGLIGAFGVRAALVVTGTFVPAVVLLGRPPLLAIDRAAKAPDAVALTLLRRLPIFTPLCRRVALSRGGSGPVAESSRSDRGVCASCVDTATARLAGMSFAIALTDRASLPARCAVAPGALRCRSR